jgi:AcrR family transcriptional regulator
MHHGNRHGRSDKARRDVLEAADDLLVENGFARLTIEGIAQRAGVAKQTIYRWWSSKTEILLDAFLTDAAEDLTPPDTGDLVEDYRAHLADLAHFLTASDAGAVFRALTAEGQHDPALAERLRAEHLNAQRARDRAPLERAVARGELPAGADLDVLVDRLVGPVYYRALVTGQDVPAEFVDDLVRATLRPASRA